MLLETAIDIAGLTTIVTAGTFAWQNVYPDRHKERARFSLAIEFLAPRAGLLRQAQGKLGYWGENVVFLPA